MTEAEWSGSIDPWAMLESLRGEANHRKLRLFAVGCCRQVWDSIRSGQCCEAVETSERFADGLASTDELLKAAELAARSISIKMMKWGRKSMPNFSYDHRAIFAAETVGPDASVLIDRLLTRLRHDNKVARLSPGLLRCLFGPFPGRWPTLNPDWLTPRVVGLSRSIYDDRGFDAMPILGDALEESGCYDESILQHCRSGGPHVRGCWVVDLILGKS